MKEQIIKHLSYNCWANEKISEKVKDLDEALLDKELSGSFPSIKKTLLHIWDAESIWLDRIEGKSITTWPSATFDNDAKMLLNQFNSCSNQLKKLVTDMDETRFNLPILYKNMQDKEYRSSVSEIVFHVINHGSFHRGQLINMFRAVGVESFESMDMITFWRL